MWKEFGINFFESLLLDDTTGTFLKGREAISENGIAIKSMEEKRGILIRMPKNGAFTRAFVYGLGRWDSLLFPNILF